MPITRPRLSTPVRLGVVMCWTAVAFLGVAAIALLAVGLDLRHHAVETRATVTAFYRTGRGG